MMMKVILNGPNVDAELVDLKGEPDKYIWFSLNLN
jgi:hypothetical protein